MIELTHLYRSATADLLSVFSHYAGQDSNVGARLQVGGWLRLLRDSRLFTPALNAAKAAIAFAHTLSTITRAPGISFKENNQMSSTQHPTINVLPSGAMDIHQFCDCLNAVADTRCAGVASTKNKEDMLEKVRCGHLPNHMRV